MDDRNHSEEFSERNADHPSGQGSATEQSAMQEALSGQQSTRYVLRLFVTGSTPQSTHAIANIKSVCEKNLAGRYELEVIDIYQQPELAKTEQIIAAPTLIKTLPLPLRKLIGNLSDLDRVLAGLGLQPADAPNIGGASIT
ncbi:MAG: circadian clock KaiB family protein [Chloroflexota bacterium]